MNLLAGSSFTFQMVSNLALVVKVQKL